MGSTADLCGGSTPTRQKTAKKKEASNGDPIDMIKRAFSSGYGRGYDDQVRRLRFLLSVSGQGDVLKKAGEEIIEALADVADENLEDEVSEEELVEEAVADEVGDQDELADALIEELLATIEDPTLASDEDSEAVLESANLFEDEELKEGKKTASVSDMVGARMQQYFQLLGLEG